MFKNTRLSATVAALLFSVTAASALVSAPAFADAPASAAASAPAAAPAADAAAPAADAAASAPAAAAPAAGGEAKKEEVENPFGISPRHADITWQGLDFTPAQYAQVASLDAAAWKAELALHAEQFEQLAYHLPQELVATRERIEARFAG